MNLTKLFRPVADFVARWAGRPVTFIVCVALVVIWALSGPLFKFSDTWQLIINTGTTIITFLMVFLIQNTQNRDTQAMQIKLDELIHVTSRANNELLDLEELEESELERLRAHYEAMAQKAKDARQRRRGTHSRN